jgi:hypothetical protein
MKRRAEYVSILALLDELAARDVELRLLHAELPSRPFRAALAKHPRLVSGGLALRRCPRVHMKVVVVDGELLYLGSANWTGAGLGAKGTGRRNFELGIVTSDTQLLDQVQSLYEQVWRGGECAGCKLKDECPGPLVQLNGATPDIERPHATSVRIGRSKANEVGRPKPVRGSKANEVGRRKSVRVGRSKADEVGPSMANEAERSKSVRPRRVRRPRGSGSDSPTSTDRTSA